jgi:hypothetical protein
MSTLHENHYISFIVSRSVLLRMRNVLENVLDQINHILGLINVCFGQYCRLRGNVEKYCTPHYGNTV